MTGTDGLYEIRIEYQGNIYRIFSCFDEGNLVVLFNGFQKKSQKTPTGEIEKALKIKTEYFIEKISSIKEYVSKNISLRNSISLNWNSFCNSLPFKCTGSERRQENTYSVTCRYQDIYFTGAIRHTHEGRD